MNFDDFYSKSTQYFSSSHSDGMVECLEKYSVKPCSAVDIGAGEGRNSLYLAKKGFNVTAIEPSIVGSNKIIEKSKADSLNISVINNDFLSVSSLFNNVGFVLSLTSLEHMDYQYMRRAIEEIKRMMSSGGYIYIIAFTEEDPGFRKDVNNSSECSWFIKHYFKKNELRDLFADYLILEYSEYVKEDRMHGPTHFHGKAKLFAQKL